MDRAALVVGGGIAGAASAHWLRRIGWRVTVVERAPELRAGGQIVDLRGRSRDVVERMGVLPAVTAVQRPERGTAVWDRRGRRAVNLGSELFGGDGPVAEIEVARTDLGEILAGSARDADWRFGESVTALRSVGDAVEVDFERARTERFDLVVGADGLHSRVRRLAFGAEERFVTHLGGYMSYVTVPMPQGLDDGFFHVHASPGGRALMIRSDPEPGSAKAVLAFRSPPLPDARDGRETQERILRRAFEGGGWLIPQVLAALPESPDFYFDALARVELPSWSSGRVVLVGDAAYCGSPLTGQGTAMALVGAYMLAAALDRVSDPASAIREYERMLRPYVHEHQKLPGGGLKLMAPRTRIGVDAAVAANLLLTRRIARPLLRRMLPVEDGFELPPIPGRVAPAAVSRSRPGR